MRQRRWWLRKVHEAEAGANVKTKSKAKGRGNESKGKVKGLTFKLKGKKGKTIDKKAHGEPEKPEKKKVWAATHEIKFIEHPTMIKAHGMQFKMWRSDPFSSRKELTNSPWFPGP